MIPARNEIFSRPKRRSSAGIRWALLFFMGIRMIIAGCRDYINDDYVFSAMDNITKNINEPIEVLCGEAAGVDQSGKAWAIKNNHQISSYPANWSAFGNYAGPIRNEQMAKEATHCVCFWDNKSKGTANMIENAKKYNLKLRVVKIPITL